MHLVLFELGLKNFPQVLHPPISRVIWDSTLQFDGNISTELLKFLFDSVNVMMTLGKSSATTIPSSMRSDWVPSKDYVETLRTGNPRLTYFVAIVSICLATNSES